MVVGPAFEPRLKPEGQKAYEAMRFLAEQLHRFATGDRLDYEGVSRELFRILDQ